MPQRLAISYRAIESLREADANARTHSREQIAQIAQSIDAFGWTNPILIDEHSTIIAGHGRLEAARLAGMADVPTITIVGLDPEQKRALAIADNKLALNAGWDEGLLRAEIEALKAIEYDVSLLGFSDAELDQILTDPLDRADEWAGMPSFEMDNRKAHRTIIMHFRDQQAVDTFCRLLDQPIPATAKFAWFPQREYESHEDMRYASDEPAVPDLHPV